MPDQAVNLDQIDLVIHLTAAMFVAAVMCICTSLYLTTSVDHACGPAAHAAPADDVVHCGPAPALLTPTVDSKRLSGALSGDQTDEVNTWR